MFPAGNSPADLIAVGVGGLNLGFMILQTVVKISWIGDGESSGRSR